MEKIHLFGGKIENNLISVCGFKKLPKEEVCDICLVAYNPHNDGSFSNEETVRLVKQEFDCGFSDNRDLLRSISGFIYHKDQKIRELSKESKEKSLLLEKLENRTFWQIIKDRFFNS